MSDVTQPTKMCANCGRVITFRKKWTRDWAEVKYCGERCRRNKPRVDDGAAILELLNHRARGATICPSEILPAAEKHDADRMEEVRRAARRLVNEGQIEIVQKGRVVDPSDFRGPIRLRKREKP